MNKIDFITLGCSKNLVDSEQLIRQLEANGYQVEHDAQKPTGNIVIINTCGFIGDAKEESINVILQFAALRKKNKINKLFVMGCLSQRYLSELTQEIPEVDKFYGKFDFKSIISDLGKSYQQDIRLERTLTTPKHYAYIKISEGCNRTCSYCAIPLITGKHTSRSMEDIEQEVRILVSKGVKEFQLIAQDLTYYGLDLYKEMKLAELTQRLADIEGVEWLRLHYAYPAHFPYDLLPVIKNNANVCSYIDIALQHITNNMLQLMRRNITTEETYNLLETIRKEVPGIHLRTTLMVGHPGETQEDFEALKNFVEKFKFERMGAFIYSDEEGTFSNKQYKDTIPTKIKQQRLNELMALQQKILANSNSHKIGKTLKVIIDREDNDYYIGRTEFDSPEVDTEVLIEKPAFQLTIGQFYSVLITASDDFDLYGKVN